jgi:hypothetical protein
MDERQEEARDAVRFHTWSGYYDKDDVFDLVNDEIYEAASEDEEWLRWAVDQEFRRKRDAERSWPAITDCDRLDQVFEFLRSRGILTRHRCGLTMQDGLHVIGQLFEEAGGLGSSLIGYCFYHLQDMEAAMWGDVGLWLAFGSFPPSQEQATEVGRLVRKESEEVAFTVEWADTAYSRILLKGFRWQRRGPI